MQPDVDPQHANTAATATATLPSGQGAQPSGAAVQQLQFLMRQGIPAPADVAQLLLASPGERDAMMHLLQQRYGNGYVQQVVAATQPTASEPKPLGGTGSSSGSSALPKPTPKNPADQLGSGMSQQEADANRAVVPPPPGSMYPDGRDDLQRQQNPNYLGTRVPVQPAPGTVLPAPDSSWTFAGQRQADTQTKTNGPWSTSTIVTGSKTVALPGGDQSPEAQLAALNHYRDAVKAALDQQITAATPQHQPVLDKMQGIKPTTALVEDLKAQKAAVATASAAELDALVAKNKLLVAPPEDLRSSSVTTTTSGTNLGGVFNGGAVHSNNSSTTNVTATPGGSTTTTTTTNTNELSLKGVNHGSGTTTTAADSSAGTLQQSSQKNMLTGGLIDPLKATRTWTNANASAAADTSRVTSTSIGAQSGNGFAGGTGSASIGRGEPAKIDPDASGTAPATPSASGRRPNASISAQAGVVQNDQGTGVTAAVPDARLDLGNKTITAGGYAAADGSLQVLVAPTSDGGVVITFTATVHARAGLFAGKRDPSDPITSGTTVSGNAGAYGMHNRVVTRTRTLSPDEAKKVLGDLDKLASGQGPDGKKTFGTRAAANAYFRVFNNKLSDLALGDPKPGPGETVSVQVEQGGGLEGKLGASTGDGADARASIGVGGSYEHVALSGFQDVPGDKAHTLRLTFGSRDSKSGSLTAGYGSASGTVGASKLDQAAHTYVFTVPNDKVALIAQLRAIKDEQAAKDFAAAHAELYSGVVDGTIAQTGNTLGANVAIAGVQGGTTSTVDGNVAKGKRTVVNPDGSTKEVKTLSGTQDGTRTDTASASLLGVKVAQAQTSTVSHGTVDIDGQASLDVTTSSSSSNAADAVPKNWKANDKTDLAAAAVTGGGLMGAVKKLAERVGEQSTVGAHFDDASFNALVGIATSDHVRWERAITTQYRDEWFELERDLAHPSPSQDWIDQDESPDHKAAYQLARMKSFAVFVSISGEAGQTAISRVRGEYSANAIGQTVSWPPSLQDQRAVFDDLAKKVEHLKPELTPFAEAGDAAGGNAFLDKLAAALAALRTKVENAPDHQSPTLAARAAAGVGDMQDTVKTFKSRFANAITAAGQKKSAAEIDAELDAHAAKSTQIWHQEKAQANVVARAKAQTAELTPPPDNASDAEWKAYNKKLAGAVGNEEKQKKVEDDQHAAEVKARADEATAEAQKKIPNFEQQCLTSKGSAFRQLDQCAANPSSEKLLQLGTFMRQWAQQWNTLHDYYKDAGMPDGYRVDLKPALYQGPFQKIASSDLSDNWKGYAAELKTQWATL